MMVFHCRGVLARRLELLQPIVFSKRNQHVLTPKGRREPDLQGMFQCLEFETGQRLDNFEITGEFEDEDILDAYLKDEADRRGNRSSDLTLPPN